MTGHPHGPARFGRSPARRAGSESGQSLVEFVLVLGPLLLILFGILELGLVMFDKVTVVNDAREAARLASVNDASGKTLLGDAPAGSSLTFTCATDPNSGNAQGSFNVGDKITAHVTYVHSFVTPLISTILGSTINLSSNATMTLEGPPTQLLLMRTPRAQDGAVLLLVAVSLTVLLGMAALVADLGQFRAHRRQLQTAADAGALAGALQLPPFSDGSNSCARANTIERQNTNLTDGKNMVVNGNLSTSYCEIIGNSVRVKPVESSVPYIFGRVLGFASTTIDARARARVVYLTRSTGLLPFGVEDLRPKSVTAIVDKTRQTNPAGIVRESDSGGLSLLVQRRGERHHRAACRRIDGFAGGGRQHQQGDRLEQPRLRRLRPGANNRVDGDGLHRWPTLRQGRGVCRR